MIKSVEVIRSSLAQVKSGQIDFETFAYQLGNAGVNDLGNTYPAIAEKLEYLHDDACDLDAPMWIAGRPAYLQLIRDAAHVLAHIDAADEHQLRGFSKDLLQAEPSKLNQ